MLQQPLGNLGVPTGAFTHPGQAIYHVQAVFSMVSTVRRQS